ncbi:D-serine deaminase, pyridoxal phosphate-dependent [Fodinibius salinus]|uniref:D-serine deaminase, pyridoxal phosphate-dependent n=1 Tax=Fodinibius salinus TaxID=860790 RepID=A0A5D3YQP8_9BACT|nr:alanine racemase [Fodinibius salinus]TYP95313.1 D-serine deaminase, pyridoxal phosphate-dependent [Fodinibius salinus]
MLSKPTLILDSDICKQNIARMAEKADQNDMQFKPHMKTHQCAEVGEWMKDCGVEAITVSSVKMAHYFAKNNWDKITIAMPAHPDQISTIDDLAEEQAITLLVNHPKIAREIDKKLSHDIQVFIEFDSGAHRTGLTIDQKAEIETLIKTLDSCTKLRWKGFYSHPGHSYDAHSSKQVKAIHQEVLKQCEKLRNAFEPTDRKIEICIGDTPCCSVGSEFKAIDAISPGNFVFYDLMQYQIGSCEISNIAVAMQCPIIDNYPERSEIVIHGGAIHFSKETLLSEGISHYGMLAETTNDGHHWKIKEPVSYLKKLSQEHGVIHCSTTDQYNIGDRLTILPVHSCLSAHLMGQFRLNKQMNHYINQM